MCICSFQAHTLLSQPIVSNIPWHQEITLPSTSLSCKQRRRVNCVAMTSRTFSPMAIGIGAAGALYFYDEQRRKVCKQQAASVYRVANLVGTVTTMSFDYYWTFRSEGRKHASRCVHVEKALEELSQSHQLFMKKLQEASNTDDSSLWQEKLIQNSIKIEGLQREMDALTFHSPIFSDLHTRNAKRLLHMCEHNQGLYIKLGQHVCMLDHIVPLEYQRVLSKLLANNPVSSFESVVATFEKDIGKHPLELFSKFEEKPLASASLAQVHVAYGKNGEKYAVKIQHDGLRESSTVDRAVITFVVDEVVRRVFEGFDYRWLTKEMNKNMPIELDFNSELKNLQKCALLLKKYIDNGVLIIPRAFPELSSKRVLTMSFEEGVPVSDKQAIVALQLSTDEVAKMISTVFCEQIYRHGFVHCDPHPANILVRANPSEPGHPQIVMLDHGLYTTLGEDFRRDYARLWEALILGDVVNIEHYCKQLNAGEAYKLLASMLMLRSWDDVSSSDISKKSYRGHTASLQANAAKLSPKVGQIAQKYYKRMVSLMGQVPPELLLLFKTNDCLRHLDNNLGNPINTATVIGQTVADVIAMEDLGDALLQFDITRPVGTLSRLASAFWSWFNVTARVYFLSLINYCFRPTLQNRML